MWCARVGVYAQGRKFDQDQFDNDVFRLVEEPFTFDTAVYPTSETGLLLLLIDLTYKKIIIKFFIVSIIEHNVEKTGVKNTLQGDSHETTNPAKHARLNLQQQKFIVITVCLVNLL